MYSFQNIPSCEVFNFNHNTPERIEEIPAVGQRFTKFRVSLDSDRESKPHENCLSVSDLTLRRSHLFHQSMCKHLIAMVTVGC